MVYFVSIATLFVLVAAAPPVCPALRPPLLTASPLQYGTDKRREAKADMCSSVDTSLTLSLSIFCRVYEAEGWVLRCPAGGLISLSLERE